MEQFYNFDFVWKYLLTFFTLISCFEKKTCSITIHFDFSTKSHPRSLSRGSAFEAWAKRSGSHQQGWFRIYMNLWYVYRYVEEYLFICN